MLLLSWTGSNVQLLSSMFPDWYGQVLIEGLNCEELYNASLSLIRTLLAFIAQVVYYTLITN